jgi:hypothetical protein
MFQIDKFIKDKSYDLNIKYPQQAHMLKPWCYFGRL